MAIPAIPDYITVHLGKPNQNARNITVPFPDYIKNVASSEIYPTWPENAIRANILAQVTFALNRVYTEYYRSRGYDFDITNSTQYDQSFVENREIFSNISSLVDELFNDYITVGNQIQPYFTAYCDGVAVKCDGLSQWGSVALAKEGYTPYEILKRYYGDNINIVTDAPIRRNIPSYPGELFRIGSSGEEVLTIQKELNRIGQNYPNIPKIPENGGVYDRATQNAVKEFQRIFNLKPDGIVGKETWYKLKYIYFGVKSLSDLYSEGLTVTEAERRYQELLRKGDVGTPVWIVQYYLAFIGYFNDSLPRISVDGIFGDETENAVKAFQSYYGLGVDGLVGRQTWRKLQEVYGDILRNLPQGYEQYEQFLYPGTVLTTGSKGRSVENLQTFINKISRDIPSIPGVTVDGDYGSATATAVREIQRYLGLPVTGSVEPRTWEEITRLFRLTT